LDAYTIDRITTTEELERLQPEWSALHAETSPRNPFLTYEWTAACWRHVCRGARLHVLTARQNGRLVAVAPLCLERRAAFRVLRFIGDGRSDYLGLLESPGSPHAGRALLDHLAGASGDWDLALFRQLCPTYTDLHETALPPTLKSEGIEGTVAPYLEHPGPFTALVKEGPSSLRRAQRAVRKFEKEGGTVERRCGADAAELVEAIATVEARSWKGREGCARFQPGSGQELLRQALRELGGRGEMEIWVAWKDERPVAFLVNFLTPERVCYYQGAYDEEHRKLYLGGLLHYRAIERAWEAGLREYDFMSGDEAYKTGWTTGERTLRYRAVFPPTPRGYLAFATLVAPRWRLKQSPHAHAALRLWVQLRNNPAAVFSARAAAPAPAAESGQG